MMLFPVVLFYFPNSEVCLIGPGNGPLENLETWKICFSIENHGKLSIFFVVVSSDWLGAVQF